MHGMGLELDVRAWFEDEGPAQRHPRAKPRHKASQKGAPSRGRTVPRPAVPPDLIRDALRLN
jgi:hypothetical protein